MASRSGSQQRRARQTAGGEHSESDASRRRGRSSSNQNLADAVLPTASMNLDEAVGYIGTELRAEAALQEREGTRGKIAREKDLGKLVYDVACARHLPKGSAVLAQGRLYDLAVNLKAEGLNAVLLGKAFKYFNRFYVKQQNLNPI